MTPVKITPAIQKMNCLDLKEKLKKSAEVFIAEKNQNNLEAFEMYFTETLVRILEHHLGFKPLQNKFFERVEAVYGANSQHTYNINRVISALRRGKMFGMEGGDPKYETWLQNRVEYSLKKLKSELEDLAEFEDEVNEKEAFYA